MTELAHRIKLAIEEHHACEVVLRVSRYSDISGAIKEPAAWQCIIKFQDAESGPWGVGIRKDPIAALEAALQHRTLNTDKRPEDVFG